MARHRKAASMLIRYVDITLKLSVLGLDVQSAPNKLRLQSGVNGDKTHASYSYGHQ